MIPQSWAEKPYSEWTNEDVLACARWWAEELGLSSWTITAVFEPRYIVEGLARCKYNPRTESAVVQVAPWAERDHADPVENGMEEDIVHELLHARFWAIDQPSNADTAESAMFELAIDRTAHALVRQRRRGR